MTESPFLSTIEAAKHTTLSKTTLERFRVRGGGPPYHVVGTRVVYDREKLDAWIRNKTFQSTSEYAAA
jgi:hypothetical protein